MRSNWLDSEVKLHPIFWILLIGGIGFYLWDSGAEEREQERMQRERNSVSLDASVAGSMWASATRSCNRIGIADVRQCAEYRGSLIQEQVAPLAAASAISSAENYFAKCRRHYEDDYCVELVNRAYRISLETPPKPGD